MENMKCVLITKDEKYGERFCKCVRESSSGLNLSFTENEEEMYKYEVVLWDCETMDNDYRGKGVNPKELLVFEIKTEIFEENDYLIYKYDSLTNILSKIIRGYNSRKEKFIAVPVMHKQSRVTAVSAVHGGAGCSSVAMAIARDYAFAGHRRTMYISLQSRSEEVNYVKQYEEKNLRELIYRVLYGNQYDLLVDEYTIKDYFGVDVFRCGSIVNELSRLTLNQWHDFFEFLVKKNIYDEIVIDLGKNVSNLAESARILADCNVLVYDKKKSHMLDNVVKEIYNDKKEYVLVENFSHIPRTEIDKFFEDDEEEKDEKCVARYKALVCIEPDDEAFFYADGLCDIRLDTDFGKKIRDVIKIFN